MCLSVCVSICVFVCRSVCLAIGLCVCLSLDRSISGQSVCLRASVCLYLSIFLSISVCLSVGRSSVFLNCRSVTVCTKRAGNGEEDAESERARAGGYAHKSGRLRTQERQTKMMNVELRTEAESRGLRARS